MSRTSLKECDGIRLKNFITAGAAWVSHYREHLDKINYFPVPDADTGSNMYLTFTSIVNEMRKVANPYAASAIARAAAMGGLIGSKGNSGIILSQFFRGFSESVGDREVLEAEDIALAFKQAAYVAGQSLSEPRDGTILSVARDGAQTAVGVLSKTDEIIEIIQAFYEGANTSLASTTDILPELKKAGVVDSGGKGLVLFFEGMLRMATGKTIKVPESTDGTLSLEKVDPSNIKYRFCTSFIIKKYPDVTDSVLRTRIEDLGDSLIVDKGIENVSKIHIHTNVPDIVLEMAAKFGVIESVSIDDMKKQAVDR